MKNKNKKKNLTLIGLVFSIVILGNFNVVNGESSRVNISYCNGGASTTTLDLGEIGRGDQKEICVSAINSGDQKETVHMFFVDGVVNPHTPKFIACANDEDDRNDMGKFAKFVENGNPVEKITLTLDPGEKVQKTAKVTFPSDYAGMSKGCLISLNADQKVVGGKINIKFRKGNIIKATVDKDIAVQKQKVEDQEIKVKGTVVKLNVGSKSENEVLHSSSNKGGTNGDVKILSNSDKYYVEQLENGKILVGTKLKNIGNVKLKGSLKVTISNIFGYKNIKESDAEILNPGESKDVEVSLKDLPFYGGEYRTELELRYIPQFDSTQDIDKLPEELKKTIVEIYKTTFSISSISGLILKVVGTILILVLVGLGIMKIFRKEPKK